MATTNVVGRRGGEFANADPVVVAVGEIAYPITAYIKNDAVVAHTIELSVDGGTEYFEATYDWEGTNGKAVSISAPISHIRFSGADNSVWGIL